MIYLITNWVESPVAVVRKNRHRSVAFLALTQYMHWICLVPSVNYTVLEEILGIETVQDQKTLIG